ncbi:excisionase family DNA-binding protein [Tsukamurella tyrosinosolvens]|uniref:excisionase family DNA-binding protein n=1 Tax=Tsukamurella tyrosinosolvens TaxID=57704 RepID=UPI003F4A317B
MSTTEAGNLIGISDRAVRKAIAQNRLTATTAGHGYRISREAAEHYRITRKRAA